MPKPTDFPTVIGGIYLDTELYTQRLRQSETPSNWRFTPQDIVDILLGIGFVQIIGEYPDDSTAAADGVVLGEVYALTEDNIWALPAGTLKRLNYVP